MTQHPSALNPAPSRRVLSLEGLRGLLAGMVMLSHVAALTYFPHAASPHPQVWEKVLWSLGAPAVNAFLVLSGFVLYCSHASSAPQNTLAFVVRRLRRLYPMYLASLLLAVLLKTHAGPQTFTPLVDAWLTPLDAWTVVNHVFPLDPAWNLRALNPVLWSLVVEMQVTPLLPWVFHRVARQPLEWNLLLLGFSCVTCGLVLGYHSITLGLLPLFLLGALLGRHLSTLHSLLRDVPTLCVIAVALPLLFSETWWPYPQAYLLRYLSGAGGVLVIFMLLQGKAQKFWHHPLLLKLGQISYPLYLLHAPILFFLGTHLLGRWNSLTVGTVGLLLTVLTAAVLERWVDRPAVTWSRKLKDPTSRNP